MKNEDRLLIEDFDAGGFFTPPAEDGKALQQLPSSRIQALATGSSVYFTGRACKNGHVAKRYSNTGSCQLCIHERNRRFRASNPEKVREWDRSRHTRTPGVDRRKRPRGKEKHKSLYYRLLWTAKNRALRDGICFDLTEDDLHRLIQRAGGCCELTGIPFTMSYTGGGSRRPFIPSIDRISCSQGYAFHNVRLVCLAMNVALSDFGEDVFARLAQGYLSKNLFAGENK